MIFANFLRHLIIHLDFGQALSIFPDFTTYYRPNKKITNWLTSSANNTTQLTHHKINEVLQVCSL